MFERISNSSLSKESPNINDSFEDDEIRINNLLDLFNNLKKNINQDNDGMIDSDDGFDPFEVSITSEFESSQE